MEKAGKLGIPDARRACFSSIHRIDPSQPGDSDVRTMASLLLLASMTSAACAEDGAITFTCPAELRGRSQCDLESVFRQGCAEVPPIGAYRGEILLFTDFYRRPNLARRLSGLAWKGKDFEDGGTFINQFVGMKALRSSVGAGESWLDGQPCVVLEYSDGTPLFGTTRDEIRRIGPDLYLVLLFERSTGQLRGILALTPRG
jgi:hypothetical protein